MKLLAVRRLFRIQRVVIRYRLDDLLFDLPLPWWLMSLRLLMPWRWLPRKPSELSRGARLRLALQDLGPIFIKFGQLLSTRRDLLPNDIADELMLLQDRVPPFDPKQAVALIEAQLGAPVAQLFSRFDVEPLASASVAQVHAARLKTGEEVVVKVVRPGLKPVIAQDLAWLFLIAKAAERASADARRLHPVEIVGDYEKTIYDELDLLREAANASQLRRNFEGSELMYVPQVYWDLCRPKVLVMERIYGVPVTDMATLADQRTDMKLLAERGVEVFFTQVFRDSFFHADMHPGNIFVSTVKPWSPQYIAIDCGIVGSLTAEDQDYLARNLIAFFKRDYRRVAQLHIDSGWVPAHTKVNEFEAAIRTVCEPIFEKPLKDISFGQVLMRTALQHGSAAAVGAAAKNPAQHRRPGPPAVPRPGPVEHRQAIPRTLDARPLQPQGRVRQHPQPGRATAAPGRHGPRPARTPVTAAPARSATAGTAPPGRPLGTAPAGRRPARWWCGTGRWRR